MFSSYFSSSTTGGGKSLLPLLCARQWLDKLTIVVTPLNILKEDLIDRAQAAGIDYVHVWGKEDIRKVNDFNLVALRGILFVTTDLATSGAFLTFLSAQDTQYHALARIFIDEVQQCLAEYRSEVMSNLYALQSKRTGWVLTFKSHFFSCFPRGPCRVHRVRPDRGAWAGF